MRSPISKTKVSIFEGQKKNTVHSERPKTASTISKLKKSIPEEIGSSVMNQGLWNYVFSFVGTSPQLMRLRLVSRKWKRNVELSISATVKSQQLSNERLLSQRDALDEKFKAELEDAYQTKHYIQDSLPSNRRHLIFTQVIPEIQRMPKPPEAVLVAARMCLCLMFSDEEIKKKGGFEWKVYQELLKSKELASRLLNAPETVDEAKVRKFQSILEERGLHYTARQSAAAGALLNWGRAIVGSYNHQKGLSSEMKYWINHLERIKKEQKFHDYFAKLKMEC